MNEFNLVPTLCVGMHTSVVICGAGMGYHAERGNQRKGEPTQKVWFYQLDPGRSLGKTNPLNDNDLKEFVELQKGFEDSDQSWSLNVADVDEATWDCSVKNPSAEEEAPLREPNEIIKEIIALDKESEVILESIQELL